MHFFLHLEPPRTTAQEHKVTIRNGKPYFYDPPAVARAKALLTANLARYIPQEPYEHGVRLVVKWCFPRGNHKDGEYKETKPDTDNLQKMLKDCMTRLHYWKDDALVVSEIVEKFWAEIPGIYIEIIEIEEMR